MAQFLAQRWRRQPQGPVAVDWSNPLARGLRAVFDQRNQVELITGARPTSNSATLAAGRIGVGLDYSGTANTRYAHRPAFAVTGPITIVAALEVDTLSNYGALIAKQQTTTTYAPYELRLGLSSNQSNFSLVRGGVSSYRSEIATNDVIPSGFSGAVAVTRDVATLGGGSYNVFVSGRTASSTSSSADSNNVVDDGASDVWIGRRYDGATQLDGRIFFVALYERALPDAEGRAVTENPWQLFRAPKPVIFSLPGGATIPTLSAATAIDIGSNSARPRVTITI